MARSTMSGDSGKSKSNFTYGAGNTPDAKPKAKTKSNFTYGAGSAPTAKKNVVKQDTIDFIKAQGMTRALKRAGEIQNEKVKGEAEFIEGVRRMYGAARLNAATKAAAKAASTSKTKAYNPRSGNTPDAKPKTTNKSKKK